VSTKNLHFSKTSSDQFLISIASYSFAKLSENENAFVKQNIAKKLVQNDNETFFK
jgi:hypothetical protein